MALQTASLGSLNAAVAIQTDVAPAPGTAQTSAGAVSVNLLSNNLSGTITFQATLDGANWFGVGAYPVLASGVLGSPVLTWAAVAAGAQFVVPALGFAQVRTIATSFTSGAVTAQLDTTFSALAGQSYANLEGLKPSYFAGLGANTPAATPTDVAVLFGSATKTVKVTAVRLAVQTTAAGVIQYDLVKRTGGTQSAVNTAFANGTHSGPLDSSDAASTVIANGLSGVYTGNPASVGTVVGVIDSKTVTVLANGLNVIEWYFGNGRPSRCPTLRGATQLLAINGAGHTLLTGEKFGVSFEFTEE